MGVSMMCRSGAQLALRLATAAVAVVYSASAFAADLPNIKTSEDNPVPACATPGRLMAFVEGRNSGLEDKFATIAADYMRLGEQFGIRWDIAFFQMLLETGNMKFTGDVSVTQNNFAGLGATGKKEPGESFPDVPTGVQAHLEHLLLYAGDPPENPVAERTRKVKEWGVLDSWQRTMKGPMSYTQLAKKWAPTSRNYSRDIANVSEAFYGSVCNSPDPKPEMMALVHPAAPGKTAAADMAAAGKAEPAAPSETPKISGADLARRAVAEARASGSFVRSNLGAGSLIATADEAAATAPAVTEAPAEQPTFKIINAQDPAATPAAGSAAAAPKGDKEAPAEAAQEPVRTAALGAGTKSAVTTAVDAAAAPSSKCRVWTASYGGSRAIIIKAANDSIVNYTVLDVNEGTEKREADAYIAAYAKGGATIGEYSNQTQALDKAFELCPEG